MLKEKHMGMRKASWEVLGNAGRVALLCKVRQVYPSLPSVTLSAGASPSTDLQIAMVSPSHVPVFKYSHI